MKKEVSVLRNLDHKNIVKYYQTNMSEDMNAIDILLEFVPGGSLRDLLGKYGPLETEIVQNYSKQLLQGLNYLHQHNVNHRDLKSANILISSNGTVKVSDFGSSRQVEGINEELSMSVRGSPY